MNNWVDCESDMLNVCATPIEHVLHMNHVQYMSNIDTEPDLACSYFIASRKKAQPFLLLLAMLAF